MKAIANNEFYILTVDERKNRIHLTMQGEWINFSQVSGWLDHNSEAVKLCAPGFTTLIDWTSVKATGLPDFIADAQEVMMKAGLRKAARVYDRETFLKFQLDRLTEKTKFPVRSFFDRSEAEAWLDEL